MYSRQRTGTSGASGRYAGLILASLLVTSAVHAKGAKKPKDAAGDHKGGLMEEGSKDPAETEKMDDEGQFVPGKKKKAPPREGEGGDESGDAASADAAGADADRQKKEAPAEPEKKKPVKLRKTIGVFAEGLIGFGKAPIPGPNNPTTGDATSFGFLVGGHYDVTTELRLILRVPWTTASMTVGNKSTSQAALGAPEIAARYRLTDPGTAEWAVRLAVGIPIAQGNPDVTDAKDLKGLEQGGVQRMADGANGWHDPELYAPKRLPISPALLFTSRQDKLRLGAELKAVFMPKVGGNIAAPSAPPGNYEMNSLAWSALLGGSASYEVIEHGFLALSAWATYVASPTVDYTSSATAPTPVQFVLEPKILAQIGRVVPSVGFVAPIGGQLQNIKGLRIHIDAVF